MTAPEASQPLAGTFWQVDTPDRRVPGELTIDELDRPHLEVTGRLFDERSYPITVSEHGGTTMAHSSDSEDHVADWQPRDIHGELSDGRAVSLVEAQGGWIPQFMPIPYRQGFRTIRHAIMDELVAGVDQPYAALRFRIGDPHRWGPSQARAATADGGQLRLEIEEGRRWFEFIPSAPMTMSELGMNVINPITTLTSLATRNLAVDSDVHVRTAPRSPWRRVHREREEVGKRHRPLIEASELTAGQFASWIDLRAITDGLDAAVLDTLDGVAIQTQVLAHAAIAEGLHRRLYPETKRAPSLQPNEVRTARRAARTAALDALSALERPVADAEREEFANAINDAFSFVNEQTFKCRMQDLIDDAREFIPSIVADFADWPFAVKYARNTLAHKGTKPQSDSTEQFYDLLIALTYSIPWVLRTVLLKRAGFSTERLQSAYRQASAYTHYLANTKIFLANGPYAAGSR